MSFLDRLARAAAAAAPPLLRRKLVWWAVVLTQPRFLVGVCTVLRSPDGRILLFEHRFWEGGRWGVPSGHLTPGEQAVQAAARELREECGLTPRDLTLAQVETGMRHRVEIWLTGTVDITDAPPVQQLDGREITGAALLPVAEALERMRPEQRAVVQRILDV
ncbi:NUDIX hydrolase [Brachybacterium sp. EF45031]|uniref:NUDIX domain-containing protein n=1 Tax=Brachybacterium sillae TaxID=2810536 RepID=UPI00217ECF21|nr:NUDIX hydrolase [Brachybacterium sillae]MCS6711434.1 NUDIX hydrolase [Brachybacterium sillae]